MTRPINVRKQLLLYLASITTIPGGVGGGGIKNKANSVQFRLKLPVRTELGKKTELNITKPMMIMLIYD